MPRFTFLLLLTSCSLTSCLDLNDRDWTPAFDGTGYRPVYLSPEEISNIATGPAQPLVNPGKIYLLEPYLFVNERGRGIHVVDNTDPANPQQISFLSIPGNQDIAAKDHWLYADNYSDLLTFDITQPENITLVNRINNAVPVRDYPDHTNVFFECADPSKGVVVAWEKIEMSAKPKCWR